MKLAIILFLIGCVQLNAKTFSQTIRLSGKNMPLEQVLSTIERQSGYSLFYKYNDVKQAMPVTLELKDASLEQALKESFNGQPFQYVIEDHTIVITKNTNSQRYVQGVVTDEKGMPLPRASIKITDAGKGVLTDSNGAFSLSVVDEQTVLHISYTGYISQEIPLNGRNRVHVQLKLDQLGLDEVVVVGYGTQSKRNITGSVSNVNMEETENLINTNVTQAIRGRVAGVQFTDDGRPGQSGAILIRGQRSLSASNDPLIVLDGIMFNGTLSDINPNDIKSMDILKDASAAAIYGSRAANGVILITSKQGTTNRPMLHLNTYYGSSDFSYKVPTLSPDRYVQYMIDYNREIGNDIGKDQIADYLPANVAANFLANKSIDPWKAASQDAYISSLDLSLSGKSDKTNYYISASSVDDQGLLLNDQQKRIGLRTNFEGRVNDWLKLGLNAAYTNRDNSGVVADVEDLVRSIPYGTWFNEDGTPTQFTVDGENIARNPLYQSYYTQNKTIADDLFANFYTLVDFPFIKGLSYRLNYSPNIRWNLEYNYTRQDPHLTNDMTKASKYNRKAFDWMYENILNYKKTLKDHHLDITLLYGRNHRGFENTTANSSFLSPDILGWNNLGLGEVQTVSSNAETTNDGVSYMFRINYDYKNKYFLTFTTRRDGSSVFAANHKYATFPSASFAWVLTDEPFMRHVQALDFLKFRLSYGAVGNQAINPYQSLSLLNTNRYVFGDGGASSLGVYPANMPNDDLKWETTHIANIAFDFGVLKSRLSGTLEAYNMETKDLLVQRSIPIMTGFDNVWTNLGATNNKGIELTLNSINIQSKNFTWSTNLNFSMNKNKIVHLYHADLNGDGKEDDDIGNGWFIGKPIEVFYDFVLDGIYQVDDVIPDGQKAGNVRLKDLNSDGVIDANDRTIVGQGQPKYRWGVANNFRFKNFTLSVFVNAMEGWIRSFPRSISIGRSLNFVDVGWWTPDNRSNEMPSITYQNRYGHDYYQSRDFIRIQDVSLSYNVPEPWLRKMGISQCQVYASGKNVYTFTDWMGPNPERSSSTLGNFYPMARTFSLGINLNF